MDKNLDRICGLIYGQALGDAFGLVTEFEKKTNIPFILNEYKVKFKDAFPHPFRSRHAQRWKLGDWTDDTDQMICIMKSLTKKKLKCDVQDFAERLLKWVNQGFPKLGDKYGMGLGRTVGTVISQKHFLDKPHEMSKSFWEQTNRSIAANGGIMRTSVVSIVDSENLEIVKQNSMKFCQVTHYDPRCVVSCICINLILSLMLHNDDYEAILKQALDEGINYLKQENYDFSEFIKYAEVKSINELELSEPSSIGYTYKCMGCGIYAFRQVIKHHKESKDNEFDYKSLFDEVVSEGGDADTNMTVVGAICGTYIGYKKLDRNWLNAMPNKWFLDERVCEFLEQLNFKKKNVEKFLKFEL